MRIGEIIKQARKGKKITQIALAEASGITQTYLSQIETGVKTPSIEVLNNIAEAMDLRVQINLINKTA